MRDFDKQDYILLLQLMKNVKASPILQTGLCGNLLYQCGTLKMSVDCIHLENLMTSIMETWSKFSGNLSYPVPPGALHVCAVSAFHSCYTQGTLWEGKYGDLRRELLDYIIETLEKELGEAHETRT